MTRAYYFCFAYRKLKSQRYYSANAEELAGNLAIRYFVKRGGAASVDRKVLVKQLKAEPVSGMGVKQVEEWANLVQAAFDKHNYHRRNATVTDLKVEIVEYARQKWPREFSLPYYDCIVRQGMGHGMWDLLAITQDGKLDLVDVTVLLNSDGLIITREVIAHVGEEYHRGYKSHKDIFTVPFSKIVWISQCKQSEVYGDKDSFRVISLGEGTCFYFRFGVNVEIAAFIFLLSLLLLFFLLLTAAHCNYSDDATMHRNYSLCYHLRCI